MWKATLVYGLHLVNDSMQRYVKETSFKNEKNKTKEKQSGL